jgi:hypothetical protein
MSPLEKFNNLSEDLTSLWYEARRLANMHFSNQHRRLSFAPTSLTTAIKFLLKRKSRKSRSRQLGPNLTPRINRISSIGLFELPPSSASIRRLLVLEIPWVFLEFFCSCFVCFLNVCCYLVLVIIFGLSALKILWRVKPRIWNLSKMCFPLIYLCQLE